MSAQIKCETFAHKYRILKNDQQKFQTVAHVAQNFCQNFKLYSNTLFSWLSDFSIHEPFANTQLNNYK
jgi:hypothetical protein